MNKKKVLLIFFLIIFFLSISKPIYALGLVSEANKRISYEPGLERTFEFLVRNTPKDVQINVTGGFMEYTTLSRDFIPADDPDKHFYITIKFPETTPKPGHQGMSVQASEVTGEETAIGTSVSISTDIKIDVMYPGKYAEVNFKESNVINNTAFFYISANNFGLKKIESFKARVDIYDLEGNKIDTVYTNEKQIEPDKTATITAELNVLGYEIGDYRAKAFVFWDTNQTIVEKVFRVGALKINIVDYTKDFSVGTINKFEIKLENLWNSVIDDVYVIVKINDEELHSATEDIAAFGTKTFNVYWDTTNVLPGEYDVEIIAYYLGKRTMELGKVNVIGKKPEVKLAKKKTEIFGVPMITLLLVAIALLIIIIDILWMKTRKKQK